MSVIFSTQCHPKPLVTSSVSTPQNVPASNCHLPGCLQMSKVSRVLLPLLSAVLNGKLYFASIVISSGTEKSAPAGLDEKLKR